MLCTKFCTRLIIYLFLIIPSWCRLPDDDSSCVHQCFHQPATACPSPEITCRCRLLPNCRGAAICCDVNKFQLTEGLTCGNISNNGQVEALHIRNATLDILNVTQHVWKKLRYMTITDGQINSVIGEFAKHTRISCLNLSSNGIGTFERPRSLVNLFNLSFVDLSRNNLSDVPRFQKEGNVTLDISDNHPMLCPSLADALNRSEINFYNEDKTFCLFPKTFHWFNSTDLVPLSQVIILHRLKSNCIENCTCKPERFIYGKGGVPNREVVVAVNCSSQKFLSLPVSLPDNTVTLDISNNNITSLKELSDPSYQNLEELALENNQISSIQPLEGAKFMSKLRGLNLRNNKIKTLETYLFSNIKFDRNNYLRLLLGNNNLHCDCNTARDLRVWLITKQSVIRDQDEIRCENMDMKVTDLNPSKLCQSQQDWTDYIVYIITAEVLLLVGLIAKVSYDYWVFKTAGYLPWPASKMPKLPCDWLCE